MIRLLRWAALAAAAPSLWACTSHDLEAPHPTPEVIVNVVNQETVNRDVDILFMVDNSPSMQPLLNKLNANFPTFINVLKSLDTGLPNVHIAVVSSDLGSGHASHGPCTPGGQGGKFHFQPTGACTATGLASGAHFISFNNGAPENFDPTVVPDLNGDGSKDIADVFTCIANLGDRGCGFEHQLASVMRALGADGAPPPPENEGFLRDDAYLLVVLLTNEDDCSAPPDSDLFDNFTATTGYSLGEYWSYRCNEFGHVCGDPATRPPHTVTGATADLSTCHSAEDGRLLRVRDLVAQLQSTKKDPSQVLVSVIGGPVEPLFANGPYIVEPQPMPQVPGDTTAPQIRHSCVENNGEYADPGVRLADFVTAFGANGLFLPICADSFAPALSQIGTDLVLRLHKKCITGTIARDAKGHPSCSVVSHNDQGCGTGAMSCVLPAWDPNVPNLCPPGSVGTAPQPGCQPSWTLAPGDATACSGAFVLDVGRPPGPPPSNVNQSISCIECLPGVPNQPGCP
jgi:hypothetical protein